MFGTRFGAGCLISTLLLGGARAEELSTVVVTLDPDRPQNSHVVWIDAQGRRNTAPVGFGREGILAEHERFRDGFSLLGRFRVGAILSKHRFEMTPALIRESGKTEAYLRKRLFSNMSGIDFDGDGRGGEYGEGFIALEATSDTPQPFGFWPYRGVFRYYSYALHGTQDESRVGKRVTGGCINLKAADLDRLMDAVELGTWVEVRIRK